MGYTVSVAITQLCHQKQRKGCEIWGGGDNMKTMSMVKFQ